MAGYVTLPEYDSLCHMRHVTLSGYDRLGHMRYVTLSEYDRLCHMRHVTLPEYDRLCHTLNVTLPYVKCYSTLGMPNFPSMVSLCHMRHTTLPPHSLINYAHGILHCLGVCQMRFACGKLFSIRHVTLSKLSRLCHTNHATLSSAQSPVDLCPVR